MYEKYPNFVEEKWSVDDVKTFCEQYGLKLTVKEVDNTGDYEKGAIIYQSRAADSKIVNGTTLTINIAKAKPVTNTADDTGKPESNE